MKWCSRDEKNCVIKRDHKRGRGCFFGPISLIYCRWKPKKLIILGNLCQILILLTCQSPCNATQRMDYNPLNGLGWKTGRKCNLLPNFLCLRLAEEKTTTGVLMSWCHHNWWVTIEVRDKWDLCSFVDFFRKSTQRVDTTAPLLYSDWWFEGGIIETCPKHTDFHCQTKKSKN